MVPKKINNLKVDIKVRDWKISRSKLVFWIGSKKVTLMGRRFGRSENLRLPPLLLVNHPSVDFTWCLHDDSDWPPPPDTPYLQCTYCPDIKDWHSWPSSDVFFDASHVPQWTHLQVNMAEVVAASKMSAPQPEPPSAPPEVGWIENLPLTRNATWAAPDKLNNHNRASDELNAAIAADYAAVLKQHDEEGRRRVIHDRRVRRIERVRQRLTAPTSLKDGAHICVWDIIEDRAYPEMQAAYLNALVAAVNAGLFNEGKRQQSQLFSFSPDGHLIRWDKKSLATFQQATDVAAHELKLDRDRYCLQRLESLAKGSWMPRRFIARWLTEYCKLSRLPWWLEDETPNDLRGELERVKAAYVDVNGKDEWDGFREPCWTHVQTIIWRVTRDPAAVDKASTDSGRPSLGETYAKSVGAAVIEMWRLNIGEVKDAARELRRLCVAGELTAYDGSGASIDKMSWVSLEIVLDNENMLWITRGRQRVGDVVFRRDDVLGVWMELHAGGATVQPEAITAAEPPKGGPAGVAPDARRVEAEQVRPCWRIKDGEKLTSGEQDVFEMIKELWPDSPEKGMHKHKQISDALKAKYRHKPKLVPSKSVINSARRKIEFVQPK